MNEYIEKAVEIFRKNSGRYRHTKRYYAGEHNLSFATNKFSNTFGDLFREFALNMCPAIVDSTRDKLKILGFSVRNAAGENAPMLDRVIEKIWHDNHLRQRAGELHKEILKNGDGYLLVWPSATGGVQVVPNAAESCVVSYDDETAATLRWAAKYWRSADKRTRMNLFFPDRIEKYVSTNESEGVLPDPKGFVRFESEDGWLVENPFGVVPVFHFANNADIGALGESELDHAIPIQDGLNKSVLDMLIAMEACAFRQRWVTGVEVKTDKDGKEVSPFKTGIDTIWQSENPNAKFGDFGASDLEQFLKVKDGFRIDMASVTGTPLYYLMPQMRGFPSGESLRKAETRFLAKVRDRQESFGNVWAAAMSFALRIMGHADVSLTTKWEDPSPLNEREMLENMKLKKELGLSPGEIIREIGYGEADLSRQQ
jgi:hypothetical protein